MLYNYMRSAYLIELLLYYQYETPCKCMDAFKIKQNFYYKNINNQSNYYLKKKHVIHAFMYTYRFI